MYDSNDVLQYNVAVLTVLLFDKSSLYTVVASYYILLKVIRQQHIVSETKIQIDDNLTKSKSERDEMKIKLQDEKATNVDLRNEIIMYKNEVRELKSEIDKNNGSVQESLLAKNHAQLQAEERKVENDALVRQIEVSKKEIEQYVQKLESLEQQGRQQLYQHNREIENSKDLVNLKNKTIESLELKIEDFLKNLETERRDNKLIESDLNKKISDLARESRSIVDAKVDQEKEINVLKNKLIGTETALQSLRSANTNHQKQLLAVQNETAKEISIAEERISELLEENDKLKASKISSPQIQNNSHIANRVIEHEYDKLQKKYDKACGEIDKLQTENTRLSIANKKVL